MSTLSKEKNIAGVWATEFALISTVITDQLCLCIFFLSLNACEANLDLGRYPPTLFCIRAIFIGLPPQAYTTRFCRKVLQNNLQKIIVLEQSLFHSMPPKVENNGCFQSLSLRYFLRLALFYILTLRIHDSYSYCWSVTKKTGLHTIRTNIALRFVSLFSYFFVCVPLS